MYWPIATLVFNPHAPGQIGVPTATENRHELEKKRKYVGEVEHASFTPRFIGNGGQARLL